MSTPISNNGNNRKVAFDDLIACPSCDWLHYRVVLEKGTRANCARCANELYARKPYAIDRTLAAAFAGLIFLLLSLLLPFLSLSRGSLESEISVLDAVIALWQSDMSWLGALTMALIILLPLSRLLLLIFVLGRLRFRMGVIRSMHVAMRWTEALEPWAMAEIFMIGVVVSLVKISSLATLSAGLAFWSLLGFVCTSALLSAFNCRDTVWRLLTTRSA